MASENKVDGGEKKDEGEKRKGTVDRYRADEESSQSTYNDSEATGMLRSGVSTASTKLLDNTSLRSNEIPPPSPVSKNARAATLLFRARQTAKKPTRSIRTGADGDETAPTLTGPPPINRNLPPAGDGSLTSPSAATSLSSTSAARRVLRSRVVASRQRQVIPDANSLGEGEKYNVGPQNLLNLQAPSVEFDEERERSRNEYAVGPLENSRYHAPPKYIEQMMQAEKAASEVSLPSILDRNEVFHENAAAAVMALLAPRPKQQQNQQKQQDQTSDNASVASAGTADADMPLKINITKKGLVLSPKERPKKGGAFHREVPTASAADDGSCSGSVQGNTTQEKAPFEHMVAISPGRPIIDVQTGKTLDAVKKEMVDPPKQLADLLTAIATPPNKEEMDRGFMVRRKNACGALKVLTAQPKNRRRLCWTVGVLAALTSVLEDTDRKGLVNVFPDKATRKEYMEARTRAITCIINLAALKENRVPIFHNVGLIPAMIKVIFEDKYHSRQGCCSVIAYLAKSVENRLLMVQVPELIDALVSVIKPLPPPDMTQPKPKRKKGKKIFYGSGREDEANVEVEPLSGEETDPNEPPLRTQSPAELAAMSYDLDPNECIHAARQSVYATLLHLVKEKDNAFALARHPDLIKNLVEIADLQTSPSHVHSVKVLANLTRHRSNSKYLVSNVKIVVSALVNATSSPQSESRNFALRGLQNLSQEKSCRQEVASTKGLVMALCYRARLATETEEKLAAMSALKNLTDEPANLIPMTNTPECFATLMQLAHGHDTNISELVQYLACDALTTLSHWLRKIATSGEMKKTETHMFDRDHLFVPTLKPITYAQWT